MCKPVAPISWTCKPKTKKDPDFGNMFLLYTANYQVTKSKSLIFFENFFKPNKENFTLAFEPTYYPNPVNWSTRYITSLQYISYIILARLQNNQKRWLKNLNVHYNIWLLCNRTYRYMAKFCSHISHANLFNSLSQLNNNF